jgi:N-acetylglucosamine kinase-like BadF-type ATPase
LAGVDRTGDRALWEAHLAREPIARRFVLCNDAELLLAAGTPDGWGLALICGTGSICYGCAPDGRTARAGGWGYLLGDEGSGYDIARHALRLATQTADGRIDAHALLQAVLDHWQLQEPTQLIAHVYRPGVGRAAIAPLAGVVVTLAAAGDHHAVEIVLHSARELARLIGAVVGKLHLDAPPLALGGGVLGASALLQRAVLEHAGVVLGPHRYVLHPAHGAIVLAQRVLRAATDM